VHRYAKPPLEAGRLRCPDLEARKRPQNAGDAEFDPGPLRELGFRGNPG